MPKDGKTEGTNGELQTKDSPQNVTKLENSFNPTRAMKRCLSVTFDLGYGASITDIAKETGINRKTWYDWLDKPGFVEWWDAQWQKHLHRSRWKLDAIGLKKAEKSYRFWKDMQNRTGNTIPEPITVGQQINQQFNLPDANLERITGGN